MLVEVAGACLEAEFGLLIQILDRRSGTGVGGAFVLLDAESAGAGETDFAPPVHGVSIGAIGGVAIADEGEAAGDGAAIALELKTCCFAGLEGLHLPGGDGEVAAAGGIFRK